MDWDDDDEKTSVYEKGGPEDAARALLRSAPPPAAGAPPPAAGAPPPQGSHRLGAAGAIASASGGAAAAMPRSGTRGTTARVIVTPDRAPSGARWPILLAAFVTVAAIAAIVVFVYRPFDKASLLITAAGPNNTAIDAMEVVVEDADGAVVKRCDRSPCTLSDLAPGLYVVKASAAGYDSPAAEPLRLKAGENDPHKILFAKPTRGTGLRITARGTGLRLNVDGKDRGPLPVTMDDMTPGEVLVRISDERGRYEPWEKKVTVAKDEVLALEPTLKVVKGLAKIKPGLNAEGARVLLVSGNERRPLPRLPISIEITPEKPYQVVATKTGFQDYVRDITFDDGVAEKTFEIVLTQADSAETPTPPPAVRDTRPRPTPPPVATRPTATATAGGTGVISINSIPASNVLVDGRPVGKTPARWTGPAGTHTVVFVHPEYGRKMQSVTVKAGGTAVAAVRFP